MEKFYHINDCLLLIARTSSLQKTKKKLTEPHIHGFSSGAVVITFVEFGLFLIGQKQSATFPIAEIRGIIRHDITMASSKMAAH